ncbi:DUF2515 family protein [Pseudomonas gorinensis]
MNASLRQVAAESIEKTQAEYKQASRNNPVPTIDWRQEGEAFSSIQQLYLHVYEKLAMGNTTLFLDVFALHAFYKGGPAAQQPPVLHHRHPVRRRASCRTDSGKPLPPP